MSYSSEDDRNMSEIVSEIVKKRKEDMKETSEDNSNSESQGRQKLRSWLNRSFRIVMKDGRILIGVFLCTDLWGNIILGLCSEFTESDGTERVLGLVMIPKKHIVSIEVDVSGQVAQAQQPTSEL